MAKPQEPQPFSLDDISRLHDSVKQATQKATNPFREALKTAILKFLEKHPENSGVCWRQFTPYFNDGEACVFRVRYPCFVEDGYDEIYPLPKELESFFNDSETVERMFLSAFGDHVQVKLLRRADDFEVSECDHE